VRVDLPLLEGRIDLGGHFVWRWRGAALADHLGQSLIDEGPKNRAAGRAHDGVLQHDGQGPLLATMRSMPKLTPSAVGTLMRKAEELDPTCGNGRGRTVPFS
jgi:hypothetical protein